MVWRDLNNDNFVVSSAVFKQRERPRVRVGSCCPLAVGATPCIGTPTPAIVVYHPPTIVAVALYYYQVTFYRQFPLIP